MRDTIPLTLSPEDDVLVALRGIEVQLKSSAETVHILRGIDLDIAAGETVAITGASGSGKSTLMSVIGGLERPSAGAIRVLGYDFAAMNEDRLARFRRDHIGIVFQAFHLIPTMTAEENAAIPLELAGRPHALAEARAWLTSVGLGHRLRHYPSQMSGGEQQRVALARAAAISPTLLLADEPTGNLDSLTGRSVIELLFDLRAKSGSTLVLVTHDAALAQRCGRVIELADGQIVADRRSPQQTEPAPSLSHLPA